jgi:hypothetical protein
MHRFRAQPAGGDRHGGAAVRLQLVREREGHAGHRVLHQVVEERDAVVRGVVLGGAVRHFHYQTAGRLDQQRQREVAGDGVCVDAEPHRAQPVLEVGFPDGLVPLHPGAAPDVVDQDVQAPLFGANALDEALDLRRDEVIYADGDACATSAIDQLGGLVDGFRPVHLRPLCARRSPGDVDARACGTELDRYAAAGGPGGSSHQGHLALQRQGHGKG